MFASARRFKMTFTIHPELDGADLEFTIALAKSMLQIKSYPETNGYWKKLLESCTAKIKSQTSLNDFSQ